MYPLKWYNLQEHTQKTWIVIIYIIYIYINALQIDVFSVVSKGKYAAVYTSESHWIEM